VPTRSTALYNLIDPLYHESLGRYQPRESDFYDRVRSKLPAGWEISRHQIWYFCSPSNFVLPLQGWKIHVSAVPSTAHTVLDAVAGVLFQRPPEKKLAFKFAVDLPVLQLMTGKNFSRGSSCKFVTIYPAGDEQFLELLKSLDDALKDIQGPYVLSDYRYKENSIVFYRYGGMKLRQRLNVRGEKVPVLRDPDGNLIDDIRLPFPVTPDWANRPLTGSEQRMAAGCSPTLQNGRFVVESVMAFSNSGGVYKALDRLQGKTVAIKEARPLIQSTPSGEDAVARLKKEYEILTAVADTRIAPQPVALFQEWEHWFLVEEFIEGTVMSSYSAVNNILLRTRPTANDYHTWTESVRRLGSNLLDALEILHDRGIVLSDLSPNNVILIHGGADLKIIDFEGARTIGTTASDLYTPGFISPARLNGASAGIEDDYYALGAVLFSYLFPWNAFLHLRREALPELLEMIARDARLRLPARKLILTLTDNGVNERPKATEIREILDEEVPEHPRLHEVPDLTGIPCVIKSAIDHWESVADYSRPDRLFPTDPRVFATNPMSVAFGSAGIAYAWHKIAGSVPDELIQAIACRKFANEDFPPGLYVGLAGIAWVLLELDQHGRAEELMHRVSEHPLAFAADSLFHGMAGWGLASLQFYMVTGDSYYVTQAVQAGEALIKRSHKGDRGLFWPLDGEVLIGMAYGAAGIALFLLYLYLCTNDERFLNAGREALRFDLSFGVETKDRGLSWPRSAGSSAPLYPYWEYGSTGIGQVALRYFKLTREPEYQQLLEKIFIDADRKYSVFMGRVSGLAGMGDFLLDMHSFTGETKYILAARNIAATIMKFAVKKDGGIAFPGKAMSRLCCDYATGSAGIVLFFNRLMGKQESDFMLESLFTRTIVHKRSINETVPATSLR
jgi:serine/threonine protein kinase